MEYNSDFKFEMPPTIQMAMELSKLREVQSLRIADLNIKKLGMINYLLLKVKEEDWHGVQDAASDLRDIEAELKGLNFND